MTGTWIGVTSREGARPSGLVITHNFPVMGDVYSHSQLSELFDTQRPLPICALAIPGRNSFDSDTAGRKRAQR
jgi:hypothetical protein